SGGQRQRVALGRAIVRSPKVFLLDEPLSNLDAKLRAQMRTELSRLHQQLQTTFIYVTHDQTEAMTMATRIVVMSDGLIQQVAAPQELYENPCNKFVATFIGTPQMNTLEATIRAEADGTYLDFGNSTIKFPESKGKDPRVLAYAGKKVIVGIRPEHIHDEPVYLSQLPDCLVEAKVDVVEALGSETFLYFVSEGQNFTARVSARSTTRAGDTVKVAFDTAHCHLFDIETEQTIIN
ncbi:MAG: TOBE domain-containing protein, partial [Ruminococcaceae bacterium]|nr:TOBE domain-containing protein [Oscillospiraceae bacterium]